MDIIAAQPEMFTKSLYPLYMPCKLEQNIASLESFKLKLN